MPAPAIPDAAELRRATAEVMERHWQPEGYTAPSAGRYPFQWLWDSCFHAVIWAHLGDERALVELATVFHWQTDDGFVPHIGYQREPAAQAAFWGREGRSAVTQPPMYGHAAAELVRRGVPLPDEILERCRRGLRWLLRHRRRAGGIVICHPWESGADDDPRWDGWCPGGFDDGRWFDRKGELVRALRLDAEGASRSSATFEVASAGFEALVAFNAAELAGLVDDDELRSAATEVADGIDHRWVGEARTWVDWVADEHLGEATRGDDGRSARTLFNLLPVLVSSRAEAVDAAFADVVDHAAYGASFGPAGVHRAEPAFDPGTYWRGPAWPQLTYLLWLAASKRSSSSLAPSLAAGAAAGAVSSGMAEYWDPDTGTGLGAIPQSWTGLSAVMAG